MPRWVERDFNKNPQFNTNIVRFPAQQADNRSAAEKVREALERRHEQPEATHPEPLAERVKKKLQGPQLPEDAESATDSLSLQERVSARLAKMRSQTTPQSHSVIEKFESPTGYFVYRDTEQDIKPVMSDNDFLISYKYDPIHQDDEQVMADALPPFVERQVHVERKQSGAVLYTAKGGHRSTIYKRLSYPQYQIGEALIQDTFDIATGVRIPNQLKVDFNLLDKQKRDFSKITVSTILSNKFREYYDIKKNKDVVGKRMTVIGSGLDSSIFNLGRIGIHVVAVDPIYASQDMVKKKVEDYVNVIKRKSHPKIQINIFDFNTGGFKPIEIPEDPNITSVNQETTQFLAGFQNKPKNVNLLAASADSLPLKTASSDRTVSIRCISTMGAFYDFMTLSVLEGLRVTQRNGSFRILPWEDSYFFKELGMDIPNYYRLVKLNKDKLEDLLNGIGIEVDKEKIKDHGTTTLTLRHTDESFRRFQDYPKLLEQLSK